MRTFDYVRVFSSADAVREHSGTVQPSYLAGGTTLVDLVKLDVIQSDRLVDINHLSLKQIEQLPDGRIRIGALVSNTELANHPLIIKHHFVLSQAILAGASTQLRNKATTAGNLMQRVRCNYFRDNSSACNKRKPGAGCSAIGGLNRSVHAVLGTSEHCIATHPSDMCVAMAAIGGTVSVEGLDGRREISIRDFHLLPENTPWKEHALQAHELITHVTLDAPLANSRSAYLKLRDRSSYQFALASSAVILVMHGARIEEARLALGGVGTKPWHLPDVEAFLKGKDVSPELLAEAGERAMRGARAYEHNAFKIPLGKQVVIRNLRDLSSVRGEA